ncbi:hypothetical protein EDC01DRAFT_628503 [Geopyxis carbonaria]|nr:hypothetical protein EDC01DRAFT_628503 [Geopyxis carbonaria]
MAAAHLPSDMLNCHLRESWNKLYSNKDAKHIKIIQDALNCCGFKTTKDMSYPFPTGKQHPSCVKEFHRDDSRACFLPWRKHEQTSASLYLAVGLLLGLTKLLFMAYTNREGFGKEDTVNGESQSGRVEEIEDSDHDGVSRDRDIRTLGPIDESTRLLDHDHDVPNSSEPADYV